MSELFLTPDEKARVLASGIGTPARLASVEGEAISVTLSPGTTPGTVQVDLGSILGVYTVATNDVSKTILSRLTRWVLDEELDLPRLHGGAITAADGSLAVVLGASGSGKSTLVAHLVASGLGLVNDEQITVFSGQKSIGSFTRPVAIKRQGLGHVPVGVRHPGPDDGAVRLLTAAALGACPRLAGRPMLAILPERRPDVVGASWGRLDPWQAFEELCLNNLDLLSRPEAALDAFGWFAASVPMVRVRYADASTAVPLIRRLIDSPPPSPGLSWCLQDLAESTKPDALGPGIRVPRGVKALSIGDSAFLLQVRDGMLLRVSPAEAGLLGLAPDRGVAMRSRSETAERFIQKLLWLGYLVGDPLVESSGAVDAFQRDGRG